MPTCMTYEWLLRPGLVQRERAARPPVRNWLLRQVMNGPQADEGSRTKTLSNFWTGKVPFMDCRVNAHSLLCQVDYVEVLVWKSRSGRRYPRASRTDVKLGRCPSGREPDQP